MKVEIKRTWLPTHGLLCSVDGQDKWFKCAPNAFKFATTGFAEITLENDLVVMVKMEAGNKPKDVTSAYVTADKYVPKQNSMEVQHYIVRQSCLKGAIDLCCVGKIDLKEILGVAKGFERWVFEEDQPIQA